MDDDAQVMRQVQEGRIELFADLVARHQSAMFRYARSRLALGGEAEDAVQEAFLSAFRGRATFDSRRALRPWLWTILSNACRRMTRESMREAQAARAAPPRSEACAPDRRTLDDRELLNQLLNGLPEEQSEAVRLRFFGDLTYDEIGDVQSCSAATAKSRIRYGLGKLSELLHADSARAT